MASREVEEEADESVNKPLELTQIIETETTEKEKVTKKNNPELDYSMGWADDDVGTMDSSEDEGDVAKPENKPLALTAPKYSEIASKLPKLTEKTEMQKEPQKVISIDSHHKPIIVTEEPEKKIPVEDGDGFIPARSRKKS